MQKCRKQTLMWPLGCLSVEVHCSGGKLLYPKSENDVRIKAIVISYEPHRLASGCSQPGAKFKSFATKQEAEQYLQGNAITTTATTVPRSEIETEGDYAFVDGSFNKDTSVYGYGGFLSVNRMRHPIHGSGSDPEMSSMRNVAGEIEGALTAARKAYEMGVTKFIILYDYVGIEEWVTGGWKCNKKGTAAYRDKMREMISKGMVISFVKVAAHTGIPGNEYADKLAKYAVGLGKRPEEEKSC